MDVKSFLGSLLVISILTIFSTGGYVEAGSGDKGTGLDVSIPSALPNIKTYQKFQSNGNITTGYYNTDTGHIFESGPKGKIVHGDIDRQGNITLHEYGGEDGD